MLRITTFVLLTFFCLLLTSSFTNAQQQPLQNNDCQFVNGIDLSAWRGYTVKFNDTYDWVLPWQYEFTICGPTNDTECLAALPNASFCQWYVDKPAQTISFASAIASWDEPPVVIPFLYRESSQDISIYTVVDQLNWDHTDQPTLRTGLKVEFRNGQFCGTGVEPRKSDVWLRCPTDGVTMKGTVGENWTCWYEADLYHPAACNLTTYRWSVGNWQECTNQVVNQGCGQQQQMRDVFCINQDTQEIVNDSYCQALLLATRPAAQQDCAMLPGCGSHGVCNNSTLLCDCEKDGNNENIWFGQFCEQPRVEWSVSADFDDLECVDLYANQTCGVQHKQRSVNCISTITQQIVADTECDAIFGFGNKPETTQLCDVPKAMCYNHGVCIEGQCNCVEGTYGALCNVKNEWVVTQDWGACTPKFAHQQCGPQITKTRQVHCQAVVADILDEYTNLTNINRSYTEAAFDTELQNITPDITNIESSAIPIDEKPRYMEHFNWLCGTGRELHAQCYRFNVFPYFKICTLRCVPVPTPPEEDSSDDDDGNYLPDSECSGVKPITIEYCDALPACENGGGCNPNNGQCVCIPGWKGPLCEQKEVPSRLHFWNATSWSQCVDKDVNNTCKPQIQTRTAFCYNHVTKATVPNWHCEAGGALAPPLPILEQDCETIGACSTSSANFGVFDITSIKNFVTATSAAFDYHSFYSMFLVIIVPIVAAYIGLY